MGHTIFVTKSGKHFSSKEGLARLSVDDLLNELKKANGFRKRGFSVKPLLVTFLSGYFGFEDETK